MLPIDAFENLIMGHIQNDDVTLIQADTGAGKSSRVPQMIYKEDPNCKIIITQPRRVAATSLAKRVADELGESVV